MRDQPDLQFFVEISIIDQLISVRLARALPDGLSMAGFGVLVHFARRGGEESPAQLASAFQVTKGAMTNTLQRLEAMGYVRVVPDPGDRDPWYGRGLYAWPCCATVWGGPVAHGTVTRRV